MHWALREKNADRLLLHHLALTCDACLPKMISLSIEDRKKPTHAAKGRPYPGKRKSIHAARVITKQKGAYMSKCVPLNTIKLNTVCWSRARADGSSRDSLDAVQVHGTYLFFLTFM